MAKSKKASNTKSSPATASTSKKSGSVKRAPRNDGFEQEGQVLTTNQGIVISDNHNSLKAGPRGPTLLEDFVLREKIMSFDHERIPERAVHARGCGAFGYFECTEDMSKFTSAGFLSQKGKRTPLLTRFSTVAGSRGSADTARDVRGFAVKFYTEEGNYDLVGNNIPVFFIQDAIKFPDLIHAAKGEPHNEIPQAQTAHDNFWDFISLMPESLHMACWIMSDRTLPRSLRMMEGFGVHTFRFINKDGVSHFVKFHWKPVLSVSGLPWEESQQLGGLDPDFHRRDLWEAIENEAFPTWELGVQIIPEKDEFKFPFDLLDPTKLVPEELVPVKTIGRMVLDRNPDNYFAEIEQVAFHPANLVPGIGLTNDPLLQGRLFSYTDTQLTRLGGPNFGEIPVNRPLSPVHNHNQDGFGRQLVSKSKVNYEPNSRGGGCPFHAMRNDPQAFTSFTEKMRGHKVRIRSRSFADFHTQATLFYNSQTPFEQQHMKDAFTFELSKVETPEIRQRMIEMLMHVSLDLAQAVADNLGTKLPKKPSIPPYAADPKNNIVPKNFATATAEADDAELASWKPQVQLPAKSKALSMMANDKGLVETRKVALLITEETAKDEAAKTITAFENEGLVVELVVPKPNSLAIAKDYPEAERLLASTASHTYDSVFVMTSEKGYKEPKDLGFALRFIGQCFKHCKTVGGTSAARSLIEKATMGLSQGDAGVAVAASSKRPQASEFLQAMAPHRHWEREQKAKSLPY